MFVALLVMYVWAGATAAMAMLQFAEILQEVNKLLPEEERVKRCIKGSPSFITIITIMTFWPLVLPGWIAARIRNAP